jgi:CRP/FNR family transcriptional regulator
VRERIGQLTVNEERLKQIFLFRNWSSEDLQRLASQGRFTRHCKGEVLFHGGTDCDRLLVLVDGQIQMFREQEGRPRVTLHTVKAQALIACAALFLDQCYPASGVVVSPQAEVFEYPGDDFLALLDRRPDLARKMISALAMRLAELADRIEAEHSLPAPARLARWLSEQPSLTREDGKHFVALRSSKQALAAHLGIQPETLSRAIRQLCEQGVIEREGGGFVICDANRLIELSNA